MNLSETAFLVKQPDHFDLRWFTPRSKVDLCGHATLASAHILWQQKYATTDEIRFSTRSGILKARRHGHDIELDFPLKPEAAAEAPPGLLQALGVSAKYVGKNQLDYLAEVESEGMLRGNFPRLQAPGDRAGARIIVTSRSADPVFDFVSSSLPRHSGIDEDPVTGSAHCCLGDFWRKRSARRNSWRSRHRPAAAW